MSVSSQREGLFNVFGASPFVEQQGGARDMFSLKSTGLFLLKRGGRREKKHVGLPFFLKHF